MGKKETKHVKHLKYQNHESPKTLCSIRFRKYCNFLCFKKFPRLKMSDSSEAVAPVNIVYSCYVAFCRNITTRLCGIST